MNFREYFGRFTQGGEAFYSVGRSGGIMESCFWRRISNLSFERCQLEKSQKPRMRRVAIVISESGG
jgi:hypothetical protein